MDQPLVDTPAKPPPLPQKPRKRELRPAERLLAILCFLWALLSLVPFLTRDSEAGIKMLFGGWTVLIVYFIPSLVGSHKKNAQAILALNAFLGWTFIGWVVALVWSKMED